jgi:hypothetical protein
LSFIWLIDCYQILIIPPLLHAENYCTIANKIYSKTKAFLIQFSWHLCSILYHKSRACIPNFKPIQIDLITQTWLRSQLTEILQYRTYFNQLSYTSSKWIKHKTNFIEYFHKTYIHSIHLLKVISWIYPTQINPNLITKHLSIQTSYSKHHCIFIQFNQLICIQMKWSTRDILWLAHDHPISKLQLKYFQATKYF